IETGKLDDLREIILRDLNEFEPGTADLSYDADDKIIESNIVFPLINYSGLKIDSLEFHSKGDEDGLFANLFIKAVSFDTLGIKDIDASLNRVAEGARLELSMNKKNPENSYHLAADMLTNKVGIDGGFRIEVKDSLILNGENWNYRDNGGFSYNKEGIQVDSIEISRNGSSLAFHKVPDESSLNLNASNFDLKAITRLVNTQSAPVSGILSGALTLNADGTFMGDGEISDLSIYEAQFGRLTWSAEKEKNSYRAQISNRGDLANFDLKGTLTPISKADSELELQFNLNKFNAKLIEQLAPTFMAESSGDVTGRIDITGTTSEPKINGKFTIKDSRIRLVGSNNAYAIRDESIDISPGEFKLKEFTIYDDAERPLKINGAVTHEVFESFKADLNISSDEFEIINIQKRAGESVYGKLIANIDVGVKGNLTALDIKANIGISPKTELTYVVSFESEVEAFEESLLVWTDFDESEDDADILTREKESTEKTVSVFANTPTLDGKINIDKNATFNVIIDSVAGDYLTVKGGGILGVNYDQTGNLRLSGNYEVTSGYYQMTFYGLVKKRFDFQKGSRLVWNGEPTNASMNITALYKTRTGIANLMLAEPGASYNEAFQQQLPFEVVMDIKGELLEPEIFFSIRLEESKRDALGGAVASRLKSLEQNESEMNKQVFALLILNSFIPAGSNSGSSNLVANQARNSASQILTQQLNNLSDKFVQGIDINMDLNSYGGAAGEGNTDLNVNVAKSFFDDRVTIRVGSSIALESNDAAQSSQQMMTNIEAEYKLTRDGRYRLKAFSKTDLEDIVVGRITRTGGGFIFQRDFNRFKNLFKPRELSLEIEGKKDEQEKSEGSNTPKTESD
ncbi:MAG TPA: translocation/assembly module TamB domain-containing protein, partial [Cryomorphaceae bacterium]|nr:translocation/assembly module TamB domain-containing protein [Cryomorphaceae bacterium]